jgi:hypothetical protein
VGRSYTFVDAMAKFGSKLAQKDLGTAYVRAGSTFDGALSQYFVVLKDDLGSRVPTGANRIRVQALCYNVTDLESQLIFVFVQKKFF